MACNENVIKNMANEITRECQAFSITVDPEFVIYLIDLYLLNPKYGKLFSKTINRNNLAYFVEECVAKLKHGGTALNILKIQFIIQTNYNRLQHLIEKHHATIQKCLRPLLNEILEADPDPNNEAEFQKLFRRISIYFILASGLGNPGFISTLKEGMAALESVLTMEELKHFVALPRPEKSFQLEELMGLVSGVRLFNRDCKKGGEGIPDLPFILVDAGKACMFSLSNSLITVMQRVNSLTTAIEDAIIVQEETGNVVIHPSRTDVTREHYQEIFDLLAFNRQYELFIRKLLSDVESMTQEGAEYVERVKAVLEELHNTVRYKDAVPVQNVFPLFSKLWQIWRAMQDVMYLVSTVNRLMSILAGIHEQIKMPYNILDIILKDKTVTSDQSRMDSQLKIEDRLSLSSLANCRTFVGSTSSIQRKHAEFLGFCALCLGVGALVPSNMKLGQVKVKGALYGFCNVKMASRFSKEPERYINEALNYARNNPHLINLLNIVDNVYSVKDIDELVVIRLPAVKMFDKDAQTETHPIPENIDKNYSWDLWEWKRKACQWASIVKCQTHSTQTNYSHLRSEIHCQTVEPRDKCQQTKKDTGMNTIPSNNFIWGLRGQRGYGQHLMDLSFKHSPLKPKVHAVTACTWPCIGVSANTEESSISDEDRDFYYFPTSHEDRHEFDY